MRILLVSSWYPPVLSGSSLWTESLAKALRQRGHTVEIVTACWPGLADVPASAAPETVHRLPARLLPRNRFVLGLPIVPFVFTRANRKRMLELTAKFRPDVIHQVNHIFDTVFLSAYAAEKLGIPLVGSITTPIQSNSPLAHNVMGLADLATVYRFGVRYWKRIICSDSTQARYVRDRYGSRVDGRLVTDIFVGVHQRYENQKPSQRTSSPHIVTVGHVHELRDPTNIIRAMPTVLTRFPDARFEIGGRVQFQRPVRETARLGLQQAVRFLGEVNAEQVADLVSKAHVFAILHQCRYAGLSFTAIEAMQFETPVVINTTDDLYGPGVIKDGENIMLVDGKNPGEIAAALIALLQDAALRDRIGRNGKEFVKQHLTWERCAEKTEHLYRSLG